MAIFKRLVCSSCGKVAQVERPEKTTPYCSKCGGPASYSEKWYASLYSRDAKGALRKTVRAVHANRKMAEEYLARMEVKRADGEILERKARFMFAAASELFLADCKRRVQEGNMGARTLEFYEGRIRANLLPHFGRMALDRITPQAINDYKSFRLGQVSPASVNRELATLSRLFSIMILHHKILSSPFKAIEMVRENNRRDRFLSDDEISRLLAACVKPRGPFRLPAPKHLLPIVVLAINTGLRLDGILGLRWEHIDWSRNEITRSTKGRKVVKIPMTRDCRETLQAWRTGHPISLAGWVFPNPDDPSRRMRVDANIGFDTSVKLAGLEDFTFHDLRHTFATHFLARTGDIHTLSQILGHSSTYMTERYAHLLDEKKREAMRIFEEGT